MKRYLIVITILAFSFSVKAQQKVWTLGQCIDYAMEHNVMVLQSKMNQETAEYQHKMARHAWLPSLNASASEGFGFGMSPSANGIYVPNNSSSTSFGISMDMPVFSGLNIYNRQKSSDLNLQASEKDLESVKFDIELAIMGYYMQVVYNKELKTIAEKQLALTQEQHAKTQELFAVGMVAESDVYESTAQVATAKSSLIQADNTLMLSLLDLAQALDIDDVAGFDVVSPESFTEKQALVLPSQDDTYNHALVSIPRMQAENLRLEKTYYDLKSVKSAWYPQLSLYAGFSDNYYRYFNGSIANESFGEQLKNNGRTSVGLQLNIPIFNRMQTKYNVETAKISIKNQELTIDNEELKLKKEIQQAYYNALAAEQKYDASRESYNAAEIAYRFSNESYTAGKATLLELNESKNRLFKSESEMLQAK
ncbi:MAG: TolC family protein, partial [Bacteroidales bacterium]|nr:TolC family protein [Bacteroidales bacterium]